MKFKPQIEFTLQIIRLFILLLSKWLIFQAVGTVESREKLFKEILPFFPHKVSFCFPLSFSPQQALYSLLMFWIMKCKWACIVYLKEVSLSMCKQICNCWQHRGLQLNIVRCSLSHVYIYSLFIHPSIHHLSPLVSSPLSTSTYHLPLSRDRMM